MAAHIHRVKILKFKANKYGYERKLKLNNAPKALLHHFHKLDQNFHMKDRFNTNEYNAKKATLIY